MNQAGCVKVFVETLGEAWAGLMRSDVGLEWQVCEFGPFVQPLVFQVRDLCPFDRLTALGWGFLAAAVFEQVYAIWRVEESSGISYHLFS